MDCLPLLRNIINIIVDVWEIRRHKLYDSDSGSGLQLHILSLHLGEEWYRMVSLERMVSLARMVCLVRKVKCN